MAFLPEDLRSGENSEEVSYSEFSEPDSSSMREGSPAVSSFSQPVPSLLLCLPLPVNHKTTQFFGHVEWPRGLPYRKFELKPGRPKCYAHQDVLILSRLTRTTPGSLSTFRRFALTSSGILIIRTRNVFSPIPGMGHRNSPSSRQSVLFSAISSVRTDNRQGWCNGRCRQRMTMKVRGYPL